jgi:uncharacterized membrane protein YbhN (UPF0104 family)
MLAVSAAIAIAALVVGAVASGRADAFVDALVRALHADWRLVAAAVAFEVLSFASYVALFHAVFRRSTANVSLRASYEITVAGTAATRLAPTAGLGGVALTAWALRRAGLSRSRVGEDLLAFLVLLYTVYLGALLAAGVLIATGTLAHDAPVGVGMVAAGIGAGAIAGALLAAPLSRAIGERSRAGAGARFLERGVRRAIGLVRTRDPALAGAVGWWAFDVMVLWSTFEALGAAPPVAALVLGYFVGTLANTLPLPGAVSGGMIGAQVALGASLGIAIAAVLAYRAIALWLPALAGAHALPRLRRTVAAWGAQPRGEDVVGVAR